jgi:ketosteroid isomerase-like protein
MSQENVELVRRLQPGPDMDLVQLFRDDEMWSDVVEALAPFYHPDCEFVAPGVPSSQGTYAGLDGLRAAWLEWLAPWRAYRVEIEEAIDLGESVLVLPRDFGSREETTQEINTIGGAVWTVRDGKIIRIEFYPTRAEALKAVGLAE